MIGEGRVEVVEIIWSYVDDTDSIFDSAVTAAGLPNGNGSGKFLDSVCGMLQFIQTESDVDRIRWWLQLLYFLARCVGEQMPGRRDKNEVVKLLP